MRDPRRVHNAEGSADVTASADNDVRVGLVTQLRAAVREGNYHVDAEGLARAMVERGEHQS